MAASSAGSSVDTDMLVVSSSALVPFCRDDRADGKLKKQKTRTSQQAEAISIETFQALGGEIINRTPPGLLSGSSDQFEKRWIAHFEVVPYVCLQLWELIVLDGLPDQLAKPHHLLWALLFLKTYSTEAVLAGMCGCNEDTFRKYCWLFVDEISYLEHDVVCSLFIDQVLSVTFFHSYHVLSVCCQDPLGEPEEGEQQQAGVD